MIFYMINISDLGMSTNTMSTVSSANENDLPFTVLTSGGKQTHFKALCKLTEWIVFLQLMTRELCLPSTTKCLLYIMLWYQLLKLQRRKTRPVVQVAYQRSKDIRNYWNKKDKYKIQDSDYVWTKGIVRYTQETSIVSSNDNFLS